MSKKKQKHRQRVKHINYSATDWHHILFQKRHWQNGYAKALREHRYMGAYIPQFTLHRTIHSKIHDVPCPNGKECRMAYEKLLELERQGLIDVENDSLEMKIDFLINLWKDCCPATVAILEWQKEVVTKYYL